MAKIKQKYVASITLRNTKKQFIMAGEEFEEGDISAQKFESATKDGTITKVGSTMAKGGIIQTPKRSLVDGIRIQPDRQISSKRNLVNKIEEQEPLKKDPPAVVWDADPEQIKDLKFEQLMAIYTERCEQFELVPANFAEKQEVIDQLSSQFVKKGK